MPNIFGDLAKKLIITSAPVKRPVIREAGVEFIKGLTAVTAPKIGREMREYIGREYAPTEYRLGLAETVGTDQEKALVKQYRGFIKMREEGQPVDMKLFKETRRKIQDPESFSSKSELEKRWASVAKARPPKGIDISKLGKEYYDYQTKILTPTFNKKLTPANYATAQAAGIDPADYNSSVWKWLQHAHSYMEHPATRRFFKEGAGLITNSHSNFMTELKNTKKMNREVVNYYSKGMDELQMKMNLIGDTNKSIMNAQTKKKTLDINRAAVLRSAMLQSKYSKLFGKSVLNRIKTGGEEDIYRIYSYVINSFINDAKKYNDADMVTRGITERVMRDPSYVGTSNWLIAKEKYVRGIRPEDMSEFENTVEREYKERIMAPIVKGIMVSNKFYNKPNKAYMKLYGRAMKDKIKIPVIEWVWKKLFGGYRPTLLGTTQKILGDKIDLTDEDIGEAVAMSGWGILNLREKFE